MIRPLFLHAWLVVLSVLVLPSSLPGQGTPEPSAEERESLSSQREALTNQAIAKANQGEYSAARQLLEQVVKIEKSIFGDTDPELLDTFARLAWFARAAGDRDGEIAYRGRAYEVGRDVYAANNFRLRDLKLSLDEARRDAVRTAEQRRALAQADAKSREVVALYNQGKHEKAVVLAEQVLAQREIVLGKEHPDYATGLHNVAIQYQSMGDYTRAASLYVQAKDICESVFGKEHPSYVQSLLQLAEVYKLKGDYGRAEPLFVDARSIGASVLGKHHPTYASILNRLAGLYHSTGQYRRAEPMYAEALEIWEQLYGKENPAYATFLNNLGALHEAIGDYPRAKSYFLEAKGIWARVASKKHSVYANILNNLATVYVSLGNYTQAEPLLIESRTIREKALGNTHPHYATTLHNLAVLYRTMGDGAAAEPLFLESKAIRKKALGERHPDYAQSLVGLAVLYRSMGEYSQAEPLMVEAMEVYRRSLGADHPKYASTVNSLALLCSWMGDTPRAEQLYIEAKRIKERVLGKDNPSYGDTLNNLAALYYANEDYGRAEPLYIQANEIVEKTLGKDHPHYAEGLNNLGYLYRSMGDYEQAAPLYQQAVDITLKHLEQSAYTQSELQQILMSQTVRFQLDGYLACCIEGELSAAGVIERLLLWKGAVLVRSRNLRRAAADPDARESFAQLQSVASRISALTRKIPSPNEVDAWKRQMTELANQKRVLERELSRRSISFRQAIQPVSFDAICQSIPTDGVLIDFVEYGKRRRSLAAAVITRSGDVHLVNLGTADNASQAIDTWRESFGMTVEAQQAAADLRSQLWQPLMKHLKEDPLILVSTDGVLGRLPLAALPGKIPGTYLLEDHRLTLIPVPQVLPSLAKQRESQLLAGDLLLVGDVEYGSPGAGKVWPSLAETGPEIELIRALCENHKSNGQRKITLLRGDDATETQLLASVANRELLHLATHGFFVPGNKAKGLSDRTLSKTGGTERWNAPRLTSEPEFVTGYSPGQLSGLVLAGANERDRTLSRFSSGESVDDGIMTADEIAYLPLEQTELAVLSACETGLGEVAGGEGLIGIQRAFQIAGADSVVATMWKVDDAMTRKLMERFYQNLFLEEMSKLESLREAQLWVLHNPALVKQTGDRGDVRKRRKPVEATASDSGQKTNPFYWAPFVLSGDWR